jgi:hypothetical protein
MSGTKNFALHRPKLQKPNASGWVPLGVALLFALAMPVRAQRLPLPPDEQEAVNEAISRGVDYLKRTQQKSGTWAKVGVGHRIGYAVLPGLTLLECGVPPSDPIIQQAAHYLRTRAAKLDTTYELSLGILFLDRLGDPKDKKLIQTFALRLIAGQSTTGGWGYKCPLLSRPAQMELLTALRHLDPPPAGGMPLVAGDQPGMPGIAGKPGDMPGIAGGPGKKPGDLAPIAQGPGGPLAGGPARAGYPSLSGSTSRAGSSPGESLYRQEASADRPNRWRDWLGFSAPDGKDPKPAEKDAKAQADKDPPAAPPKPNAKDGKPGEARADNGKPGDAPAAPPRPAKPYVLPERLLMLPVIQDPALHVLEDPKNKSNNLILTTTDNSNTQFAILALWTAQRYDVPMRRTLNLIIRRFLTSQNADGSWGYHYRFGGGEAERPAMTCVGLIGLAVGHGLAQPAPAGQPVQDPRILNGLIALTKNIGKPVEQPAKLPMQNLYFLWSVERVAVLYNLPVIGDKDWYRWGAQVLVANQETHGNWANGQYHGNSPTLDTCLALLFLKRANLVKDLTAKLPFKAADLNNGIMEKLAPPTPPSPDPKPLELGPAKKTVLPVEPPKRAEPDKLLAKPPSALEGTARGDSGAALEGESSGSKKKWIVLSVVVFVILSGGSLFFILLALNRRKEEEKEEPHKRKDSKKKHKLQSTMSDG